MTSLMMSRSVRSGSNFLSRKYPFSHGLLGLFAYAPAFRALKVLPSETP